MARKVTFNILGKPWQLQVINVTRFKERYGTGYAIACLDEKVIYLAKGKEGLISNIRHELFHAFVYEYEKLEQNHDTTCPDGKEEYCAEVFGFYAVDIIKISDEISNLIFY